MEINSDVSILSTLQPLKPGHARTAGIMVEPLFNNFATVAFFEFIVFAIFEMRFLLTVWRARRSNTADLWQVTRQPMRPGLLCVL